ncbi:MAG: GIY-YIG nuclease family protein [Cyanobacteria bacterium HKST-UBA01]|nr:GIY-YIG nuclease family protein [Cyanobacteria bacterium HKST-UBA01]
MMQKVLALADVPVLILDCQTTGASPATGNLLEIAWSLYGSSNAKDNGVTSYLVKQPDEEAIPPRITAITGITDEDMEAAVDPGKILKELRTVIKKLKQPPLCVIHYARFELPFLLDFFKRHGRRTTLPVETICTFEIARRIYPNLPSRGIRALGGYLGLELDELKRARSHVATTKEIWSHLIKVLDEQGVRSGDELRSLLLNKAEKRKGPLEYPLDSKKRLELPDCPGVYRMLNCKGRVLYVGKATSLKSRVNSHFRGRKRKTNKSFELLSQVTDIVVTECASPMEAALIETDQIKHYNPAYNTSLKAGFRQLVYYSADFKKASEKPSKKIFLGPFSSSSIVEDVVALSKSLTDETSFEGMLYGIDDGELIDEGVELFRECYGDMLDDDFSVDNLLLLGMKLFRKTRNMVRAQRLAALEEPEPESESDSEVDDIDESEELLLEDVTAEDVLARLESALITMARSFLLSKELTGLLNVEVTYEYKGKALKTVFKDGQMDSANESGKAAAKSKVHPWKGLAVSDFDRLRVLITEIRRMRSQGSAVKLTPENYLLSRF